MYEHLAPALTAAGLGFAAGFSLGYLSKKLAKILAAVVGAFVGLLLLLEYYGIASVDYGRLLEVLLGISWRAPDLHASLLELASKRLPSAAGFAMGLYTGFKRG